MADYTLSAKIIGDSSNYQNEIKEANESTKDFIENTENAGNKSVKAGSKFANLASKVSQLAISYGLVKAATAGITYNSTMEQYQTSFEVMTGSAEKATETVERLQEVAAKTPFEMPQLADTTQLLMNYGLSADDAMAKMNMLGDIAQGNADKMSRIATAYGQMSSAGKVHLEDIKQMIEAGFNPLQEISQTTGESMESLYDRISKGSISVDEITASMQRSTSEGGKYFQSMEKQSDTLNGKFSTLKDTVQNKLGNAFQGVTAFLRDSAIPVAIDMLENWEKYEPMFVTLGVVIGTVTALIVAYNIQQHLASTGLTLWQTVCALATPATTALGAAFTFLTSPIGLTILAIGAVIAIGYLLIKNWEEVKAFGIKTWNGITTFINNTFVSKWKAGWNKVTSVFSAIFGGIVNIAKKPINGVIGLVNGAIGGLNKLSVNIPSWVPVVGGKKWGVNIPKIPYLLHGTDNFQGGFAYMNEGGRGELVNLPNGSQVIPHDISVKYAQEAARANSYFGPLEINLEGLVIELDITTEIDSMPINKKSYEYTLRKMGDKYKAVKKGSGS